MNAWLQQAPPYMPRAPLPNYLRTYRKSAGLTQAEVAFLLGCGTTGQVCRYEHFTRRPSLQTALAYEAIFRTPIRTLLGGEFRKAEKRLRQRAKHLIANLSKLPPMAATLRKLAILRRLVTAVSSH